MSAPARGLSWRDLPPPAQCYVGFVIGVGTFAFVAAIPHTIVRPGLFAELIALACITSIWKVTLPIGLSSGSTLSVSYAADLMALLLLGPRLAVVVAVAGVVAQCTVHVKQRYPLYRTIFSAAAEAIAMAGTGLIFDRLGGTAGAPAFFALSRPLVGAIATYFVLNTGLIAAAIGLSTERTVWRVWHDDFMWSAASFMAAASAGAFAAVVVGSGEVWKAVLMLAPVYATYRTYQLFAGRLDLLARERAARESAEEANRLKDQFLAIVSHELRTPLNAILGWSDILRRGALDASRHERAFRAIHESARRQAELIDELLDVSRIMSGKLRLELSPAVDVSDMVWNAVEMVQPSAEAKQVHVAVDLRAPVGTICADSARVQQIVWNLLTNAIKFSPNGGAVRVGVSRADSTLELLVTDSGPGIARDFLPFVFEPFRQADGSTTRRQGGLGLGLSIVKHLAEAHGGSVKAESAGADRGSTFVVRLPVVAVGASASEAAAARLAAQPLARAEERIASLDGLSVLVVDDDDESRAIVTEYLERQRAIVLTASSAEQALGLIEQQHIDVLLADIAMPGEDGYSLIKKVRASEIAETAAIPAAALTSFARQEDRQSALQAGFHLHLAKPIDPRRLIEAVACLSRDHDRLLRSAAALP